MCDGCDHDDSQQLGICTDKDVDPALGLATVQIMCQRVTCNICSKPTWAGCGAHVESVLGDVPMADRCQGHGPGEAAPGAKRGVMDWLRSYKR